MSGQLYNGAIWVHSTGPEDDTLAMLARLYARAIAWLKDNHHGATRLKRVADGCVTTADVERVAVRLDIADLTRLANVLRQAGATLRSEAARWEEIIVSEGGEVEGLDGLRGAVECFAVAVQEVWRVGVGQLAAEAAQQEDIDWVSSSELQQWYGLLPDRLRKAARRKALRTKLHGGTRFYSHSQICTLYPTETRQPPVKRT